MPKVNNFTPEQQAMVDKLWPHMQKLVREVNAAGDDLCFTGFLYGGSREHPMLIHLSNILDRGESLVVIHYSLARMAVALDATDQYERLEIDSAPEGSTSEEIADKLALALLQTPSGEESEQVKELLHQYLKARTPQKS